MRGVGRDRPWESARPCRGQLCVLGCTKGAFPLPHRGEIGLQIFKVSPSLDTLELSPPQFPPSSGVRAEPDLLRGAWGQGPAGPAVVILPRPRARGRGGLWADLRQEEDTRLSLVPSVKHRESRAGLLPAVCQSDQARPHGTLQGSPGLCSTKQEQLLGHCADAR